MNKKELKNYISNFVDNGKLVIKGKALNKRINTIKEDLDFYQKEGDSIQEKLYLFYFNEKIKFCPSCDNKIKFNKFSNPYQKYCSIKCSREQAVDKMKQTNLKKYGVEHNWQREDVKENIKETWLNTYGVDNPWKSEEIKEKIKETHYNRYGKWNSNIEKARKTKLEQYGNENYNNSEKRQKTNLDKYGTKNGILNNQKLKEIKMFEKYGVKNASSLKTFMDKIIKKRIENGNLGKNYKWIVFNDKKLQSSFELKTAKILNEKSIKWESHNKYLKYTINNEIKNYNPDFYLPDYDVYLEPHTYYYWNDHFLNKMKSLSKKYEIFYFHENEINLLHQYLDNLCKNSN